MSSIKLNDILQFDNLDNMKIRFNLMFRQNWNPIEVFKNGDISVMLEGQYWNYNKNKSYKVGQTTIGLVKIKHNEDFWLLFHVGKVTKDLNRLNGVGCFSFTAFLALSHFFIDNEYPGDIRFYICDCV